MRILPRRCAPLLLLPVLLVAAPSAQAATTWTVCPLPATCDFTTIQAAVDAAVDGDTISVAAGTYAEQLVVDTQVTIQGAQHGVDARTRPGTGETVIVGAATVPAIDASVPIVVDGVTIQGVTNANFGAITSTDALDVRNSTFQGDGRGIDVSGSTAEAVSVRQSRFDVVSIGLYATDLDTLDVSDNRFTSGGSTSRPMNIYGVTTATVQRNSLQAAVGGSTNGITIGTSNVPSTTTIADNLIARFHPAVSVLGDYDGSVAITRNSFPRRDTAADAISSASTTSPITATDNWFACSGTPTRVGSCDVIGGSTGAPISIPSWVTVAVTPSATALAPGQAVGVGVALHRQDGTSVAGLTSIEGAPVTFALLNGSGTTLGVTSAVLTGAAASTTATPPAQGDSFNVQATVDGFAVKSPAIAARGFAPTTSGVTTITGTPAFGSSITCAGPSWSSGTATLTWQRDGIAFVAAPTYAIAVADIGHALTCTSSVTDGLRDPASSTSAPVKVTKRAERLTAFASKVTGAKLACGTVRRPCVIKYRSLGYLKAALTPAVPGVAPVLVSVERKVGRRWVRRPAFKGSIAAKPIRVSSLALGKGVLRLRVTYAGATTFAPASSGYIYVTVK